MTRELAERLREAFGPCSDVYETMTAEEIVADARHGGQDAGSWVDTQLRVLAVQHDRRCDAACHHDEGHGLGGKHHARVVAECDAEMAATRDRTRDVLCACACDDDPDGRCPVHGMSRPN